MMIGDKRCIEIYCAEAAIAHQTDQIGSTARAVAKKSRQYLSITDVNQIWYQYSPPETAYLSIRINNTNARMAHEAGNRGGWGEGKHEQHVTKGHQLADMRKKDTESGEDRGQLLRSEGFSNPARPRKDHRLEGDQRHVV